MAWSKVKRGKKPMKWWFYKYLTEWAYFAERGGGKRYYYFLNKLCKTGFNLYGEKI